MTGSIPRRKYLADGLSDALPELQREIARARADLNLALFLERLIVQHVDEAALELILADVREEIGRLHAKSGTDGDASRATGRQAPGR